MVKSLDTWFRKRKVSCLCVQWGLRCTSLFQCNPHLSSTTLPNEVNKGKEATATVHGRANLNIVMQSSLKTILYRGWIPRWTGSHRFHRKRSNLLAAALNLSNFIPCPIAVVSSRGPPSELKTSSSFIYLTSGCSSSVHTLLFCFPLCLIFLPPPSCSSNLLTAHSLLSTPFSPSTNSFLPLLFFYG